MNKILFAIVAATLSTSASAQIYSTDFSTLDGWTVTTNCDALFRWGADATPAVANTYYSSAYAGFTPFVSAPASLNFNDGFWLGGLGGHGGGPRVCGSVVSPPIDLSVAPRVPVLSFMAGVWAESACDYDRLGMRILSEGDGTALFESDCLQVAPAWTALEFELDASWGIIQIEFSFDTIDNNANTGPGAFIDDLTIVDRCGIDSQSPCDDFLEFCFGDGTGTPCPCLNNGSTGRGCRNSSGIGARLLPSGAPEVFNDTLRFQLDGAPAQSFAFLVSADNPLPMTAPGEGIQDRDGLRCVGGNLLRHGARATDLAGRAGFGTPGWGGMDNPASGLVGQYGFVAGQSRYFQIFVRDDVNAVCGSGGNRSNGVKVTFR